MADSIALATPTDIEPLAGRIHVQTDLAAVWVSRMHQAHTSGEFEDEGITWQNFGLKKAREYADVCLLAKDLPHDIQGCRGLWR